MSKELNEELNEERLSDELHEENPFIARFMETFRRLFDFTESTKKWDYNKSLYKVHIVIYDDNWDKQDEEEIYMSTDHGISDIALLAEHYVEESYPTYDTAIKSIEYIDDIMERVKT
jgi:hypothetical protein